MAQKRTYRDEIPSHERIKNYYEYSRLVNWIATPTPLRNPRTLAELAKELSVHQTTLSRWQNVDGFYGDVRQQIEHEASYHLADVLYALTNKIYQTGRAREVKLFLDYIGSSYREPQEMPHIQEELDPEIQRIIKEVELKMSKIGQKTS